ncbi:PKD domain-containing protein [Arthrobacter sp. ISL-48]|uniref:PKD domain-containing protein n=1 Tax=Arthrobacter sp. ISL-48 TaxID=2819110 RepID=UPI001BE7399F|nr:PKD domain-containing protein [Arthrobacter sp. ISL-48]MBT2533489.1 PKD domain-containing protein [Arthrobacter sp. ISL-48]
MKTKSSISWLSQTLVLATLIAGTFIVNASSAWADGSYGTPSVSYSGVSNPPTSDKPQSKLWWNDGSWWADLWTTGSGWHIYRLDRGTETWVDTGLLNDSRGSTLADTLWDGSHLYIASHVATITGDGTPKPSLSGQPAKLYRYSYVNGSYKLDSGFPTMITDNSSESMTIDIDSLGGVWATWTQVGGNSTTGFTNAVYMNYSANSGAVWGSPFVLPVTNPNPNPAPDDISAVVAFSKDNIGVMWSDHLSDTVWWATHKDGDAATASWKVQPAIRGKGQADDHLNLKTLQADTTGRVFAAIKTSLNDTSSDPTLPQLLLLTFKPGTGSFTQSTISKIGDCVSRPQIVLDTQNNLVRAFQTAPPTSVSGCAYSGVAGSIYEKTASMDNPVFGSGRGTPIIQSASSSNMNDVTTTKQSVDNSTGLVVMASDNVAKRYWFSDRPLGSAPQAPVASFTATPTSGTAPLNVSFIDTSTGRPTSWAWNFGDGGTSSIQSPSHSYSAAGTYTVTLTATNSAGSNSATATIAVSPATTATGVTAVGSTTTYSSTAGTAAGLSAPSGTTAGDVLIASITADLNPSMASVPAGWTPIVNALSINSSSTSGARAFVYYHVVGESDPLTYTWSLSSAAKWGGGITGYRGVNNTTPLDTSVATVVDTSYSATAITAPSITTASNGAMLIGGAACDCAAPVVSPPGGWTERWEAAAGQIAELADQAQTTAGATGTATWTFSAARAAAVWRTALKPAS